MKRSWPSRAGFMLGMPALAAEPAMPGYAPTPMPGTWTSIAGQPWFVAALLAIGMFAALALVLLLRRRLSRLADDHAELAAALEHAPDAVIITDDRGTILTANAAVATVLGVSPKTLRGRSLRALIPESPGSGSRSTQFRTVRQDGSTVFAEARYSSFGRERGRRWICIVRDLTERSRAELQLRRSEALLSTVLESLPVGVWITDAAGKITRANAASRKIWGGALFVGIEDYHRYRAWWPETGRLLAAKEWAASEALKSGKPVLGQIINIEAFDGRVKTIVNSAAPLRNESGDIEGAVILNEDITERLRSDEELRLNKELQQTIVSSAAIGMALCDTRGHLLMANPALCALLGYAEMEILGLSVHRFLHPEDLGSSQAALQNALLGGCSSYQREERFANRRCQTIWALVSYAVVRDAHSEPRYLICQVVDISARRFAEVQLRALSAHLETTREDERKRVAREVHDELGQLLTALRLHLALIKQASPRRKERVHLEEAQQLVDRTLAVGRNLVANLRPAALDFGLVPALEWLSEDFRRTSGLPCVLDLGNAELGLDDNGVTTLFRVAQEALTNVIRHAQARRVAIRLLATPGEIRLFIEDDGCGFDSAAPATTSCFGLIGMRERIALHGGSLCIDSARGQGTIIQVRYPLADPCPSVS